MMGNVLLFLIRSGIIDLGAFCVELWSFFVSKRISVPMSYISFGYVSLWGQKSMKTAPANPRRSLFENCFKSWFDTARWWGMSCAFDFLRNYWFRCFLRRVMVIFRQQKNFGPNVIYFVLETDLLWQIRAKVGRVPLPKLGMTLICVPTVCIWTLLDL